LPWYLLVQPALAHVVWFDYKDREYELLFGHPESGPETFDVSKFESATAYDQNKQTVPVEINIQDGISVDSQGDIAALTSMTMGTGSRSRRMIMKTFPKTRQRQLNTRMSPAI